MPRLSLEKKLLESILKDEEDHIDWIEAPVDQIKQMGGRRKTWRSEIY